MKFAVLGGGSIGLHLAVQLYIANKSVKIICRTKQQVLEIKKRGIRYIGLDGSVQQLFVQACSIEEIPCEIDWLFLTVKQTQIQSVIPHLKQRNNSVSVICFQNGLGHEQTLKHNIPDIKIYGAITTEAAYRLDLYSVEHTGKGTTYVGTMNEDDSSTNDLQCLVKELSNTSLNMYIEPRMKERIWRKLIINACINPLTALFSINNGELLGNEYIQELIKKIFEESIQVAEMEGISIEPTFMKEIVQVMTSTAKNKSSMLQDVEAGRETEIVHINGAIVFYAKKHDLLVPTNELLVQLVLAKQLLVLLEC